MPAVHNVEKLGDFIFKVIDSINNDFFSVKKKEKKRHCLYKETIRNLYSVTYYVARQTFYYVVYASQNNVIVCLYCFFMNPYPSSSFLLLLCIIFCHPYQSTILKTAPLDEWLDYQSWTR